MVKDDIEQMLVDYQVGIEGKREELIEIKLMIDRIIPTDHIRDLDFVGYNMCCGCGDYPPPLGGYKLVEFNGMKVPLCRNCIMHNAKPDWELVAKMFYGQIQKLNKLIDCL